MGFSGTVKSGSVFVARCSSKASVVPGACWFVPIEDTSIYPLLEIGLVWFAGINF